MIFNQKYKILFLDPNTDEHYGDEKVGIILSPSLYWVKKLKLPVKSVREVKKLLPSIFEDTLTNGNYSYSAYKTSKENEYIVFAYEDKTILDLLAKQNIQMHNIVSIHFAQTELSLIHGAMKINDMQSVYIKDDILVLVPCCWIEEKGTLVLDDVKLSNHKIHLQQFGHIVNIKSLYSIGAILVLFIVLTMSELFVTNSKINHIQDLQSELFSKYNLKSTMFQNKSMLKKYTSIHSKQTKLRETFSALLGLRLNANEKINFITYKNKKLSVDFSGVGEANTSQIISALKAKHLNLSSSYDKNILHLEIKL